MCRYIDMDHPYYLRSKRKCRWSEMPEELLILILKRLNTMPDCLRFGAVCSSWQSVSSNYRRRSPPLLMLERSEPRVQKYWLFFHLSEGKFYKLPAKLRFRRKYERRPMIRFGSTKGWLFIDASYRTSCRYYLQNPITGEQIDLPSKKPLPIRGVILSSAPTSSDSIVVAEMWPSREYIIGNFRRLASCRPGVDEDWFEFLIPELSPVSSMAFHKGKLFILSWSGLIHVYAFDPCPRLLMTSAAPFFVVLPNTSQFVVSDGELLLVVKDYELIPFRIYDFRVFRLDEQTNQWSKIESLGERVLLLTGGSSECFSTADESFMGSEGFKGNCIYYHEKEEVNSEALSLYSMEDKSFQTVLSLPGRSRDADWIIPQL